MDGYLEHHGVKGQKWHHRRWQNPDGSLTPEGYIHYGIKPSKKAGFIEPMVNARYGVAKKEYRQLSKGSTQIVSRNPLTDSEKSSLGITNYIEKGGTLKKDLLYIEQPYQMTLKQRNRDISQQVRMMQKSGLESLHHSYLIMPVMM